MFCDDAVVSVVKGGVVFLFLVITGLLWRWLVADVSCGNPNILISRLFCSVVSEDPYNNNTSN